MHTLAESFLLLRRHLFPAVAHSLAYSLTYSPFHSPTRIAIPTATKTKASEQNPAESQQSYGLPEGDEPQSEQRWRQPIPQEHHHSTANCGEDHDPQDSQWRYYHQSRQSRHSHQSLVHVSVPHLFVNSS
jgi:hypothetical protein